MPNIRFKIYFYYFNSLYVRVSVCVSVHVSAVPSEARRGHQIPETGVTGDCEPPDTGARNQTQALCKSSKCF